MALRDLPDDGPGGGSQDGPGDPGEGGTGTAGTGNAGRDAGGRDTAGTAAEAAHPHDCGRAAEGVGDPVQEAHGELAMARLALADGETEHAAVHVANALFCEPALPDAHELLGTVAARTGDGGVSLYGPDEHGGMFAGSAAARAHLHAAAGDFDSAVGGLAQVAVHEPHRPWGASAAWLGPGLAQRLDPDALAQSVLGMVRVLDDPVAEEHRDRLAPFADLLRAAVDRHPGHGFLLWSGSSLMRRLGSLDTAVDWAFRAWTRDRSLEAAVMLGTAWRRVGRTADTEKLWTSVLRDHPDDLDLHVDFGELVAGEGRFDDGLAWIDRALAVDPEHPKAAPAAHGVRWARDRDVAHLVALVDHLRDHPDHGYAHELLARACSGAWLRHVPYPTEALTNTLGRLLDQVEPGDADISITLSALEPPSALLAVRAAFPRFGLTVQAVPEPDARVPLRPGTWAVWRYASGSTEAEAVPGPPDPAVAAAVRGAAEPSWPHPALAYDRAVLLSGCPLEDLLGVLVHPPAPDDSELGRTFARHEPALWVRTVQVWACLGIAHHRADEPWPDSVRRAVLTDLAFGPEDWVSDAALFALVATAWLVPEARADVALAVANRFVDAALAYRSREVTVLRSLADLVLATPEMPPQIAQLARETRAGLDAERD